MEHLKIFLKGMAMGAADVVPGVSGGTIAFITGIYTRLLDAISSVNLEALKKLRSEGFKSAWTHIDGTFLLALGAGILTAIISLAKVIHHLLMTHPVMLWSFFFGLIIASCVHIARTIPQWRLKEIAMMVVGAVVAALISLASPTETAVTLPIVFAAGSIAICAMILPGISGSFILLMLGMSAVDLLWTIMAGQAGVMKEINPLAAGLIQTPTSLALFKVTATAIGCGLLYSFRDRRRVQEATWWMCLVCVLVTFRWVMFDSMTTS